MNCPVCSASTISYGSHRIDEVRRQRYHHCPSCDHRFKSMESIDSLTPIARKKPFRVGHMPLSELGASAE